MAKDLKVAGNTPSKVRVKVGDGSFAEANLVRVNGSDFVWARLLSGATINIIVSGNMQRALVSIKHVTADDEYDTLSIWGGSTTNIASSCKYKDALSFTPFLKTEYDDPQDSQNVQVDSDERDVPSLYDSTTEARPDEEREANAAVRYYWQNQSETVSDWTETVTTTISFDVNDRAGGSDLGSVPSQQSGPSRTIRHVQTRSRENCMKQPRKAHQTRTVTANLVKYKTEHQVCIKYQTQVRTRHHSFSFDN